MLKKHLVLPLIALPPSFRNSLKLSLLLFISKWAALFFKTPTLLHVCYPHFPIIINGKVFHLLMHQRGPGGDRDGSLPCIFVWSLLVLIPTLTQDTAAVVTTDTAADAQGKQSASRLG